MRSHIRGRGAEGKSTAQQMGPTPNFPCQLWNRVLQTIFVLKKWQIRPRPLRVCVNILTVAKQECQNPPVSASRMCERSLKMNTDKVWFFCCEFKG